MNQLSLLNWMLLSTALLGAWWACYRLALRPERSFGYNRAFLVLGPLLAAGLPLLPLTWPAGWWGTGPAGLPGVVAALMPTVLISAPGTPAAAPASIDWHFWLLAAYLAGAALTLLRLAAELGRLWWQARGLPRTAAAGYMLIETHGRLPTSSFGRVVFWDETLPLNPVEARQVLAHELAHVRQHHTADRLLLELLRAALWFNPFVHLCAQALTLTQEYLADEAALLEPASSVPSLSTSYSQLLARQVASRLGFSVPLAHSFSHSQTLSRIAMIQKTHPISRWKQWLALPLLGVLLVAVACLQSTTTFAQAPQGRLAPPPPPGPPSQSFAPNTEKSVDVAEVMPEYPGGMPKLMQDISFNRKHTGEVGYHAKGKWFAKFTVGSDGVVRGVSVQSTPDTKKTLSPAELAASEEAVWVTMQVLQQKWKPGSQSGQPVAVNMVMPLVFKP